MSVWPSVLICHLKEEQHHAVLREHMEMQLKAQQMALQMSTENQKEATYKLHQLADAHQVSKREDTAATGKDLSPNVVKPIC